MGLLAEREFSEEGNKAGQGLCGDGNEREGAEGKGEGGCDQELSMGNVKGENKVCLEII